MRVRGEGELCRRTRHNAELTAGGRTGRRRSTGVTLSAPAGVTDHGLLLGLGDDDHSHYLLAAGGRTLAAICRCERHHHRRHRPVGARAADPAAHHALATAGNSGFRWRGRRLAWRRAGGGLAYAAGVCQSMWPGWAMNGCCVPMGMRDAEQLVESGCGGGHPGQRCEWIPQPGAAGALRPAAHADDRHGERAVDVGSGRRRGEPGGVDGGADGNYASQLTGWRATYAGEADFRYLFVDEMHAKSRSLPIWNRRWPAGRLSARAWPWWPRRSRCRRPGGGDAARARSAVGGEYGGVPERRHCTPADVQPVGWQPDDRRCVGRGDELCRRDGRQ